MNSRPLTERDRRIIRVHLDWFGRSGATERTLHHRGENLRRLATRLPVELLDATREHLDAWQSGLFQTIAITSVATYSSHARMFYAWAVDAGHLDSDPAARLPRPKIPKRHARPIPEKDLDVLLAVAPEPLRTWLMLAGYMGLRAHEIAQITREDVTERAGRLYLSGIGKGRKSFGMAVPRHVEPFLRAHLTGRPGPLWRTATGMKVGSKQATMAASALMRDLDMPYTLHSLRHRFGTRLWDETRDMLIVQQAMRHSSPDTTRIYIATTDGEAAAAMDRLSTTLRPKRVRGPRPRTQHPEAA